MRKSSYKKDDRTCTTCGKVFQGTRKAKYCSSACRLSQHRLVGPFPKTCVVCGVGFDARTRNVKTCSVKCSNKNNRMPKNPTPIQCQTCGVGFIPRDKRTTSYCSTRCSVVANRIPPAPTAQAACKLCKSEYIIATSELRSMSYCSAACRDRPIVHDCKTCGVRFTSKAKGAERSGEFCSVACRCRHDYVPLPKVDRFCQECGKTFIGLAKRKFCCNKCGHKQHQRTRRARKRGVEAEPVSKAKVIDRDKGICHICMRHVDLDAKSPHPASPTLDHVIPLSHGGKHNYGNCKLAHYYCNTIKGAKLTVG